MTHPFLSEPDNAKAYQTLCDCPSGSIRSWAAKAGWTKTRMEMFLLKLRALGLARIESGLMGSLFVPLGVQDTVLDTVLDTYLGSTAVKAVQQLDKLPRYGLTPNEEEQLRAAIRLIAELNRALSSKFAREYSPIRLDNLGSIAAAKKILKIVPLDRAIALTFEAGMAFTLDKSPDGELPHSLGHPFIRKYVTNEYRRIERELARGQLSLLFVERTNPSVHVYGARRVAEPDRTAPTSAETVERMRAERDAAAAEPKPQRMK